MKRQKRVVATFIVDKSGSMGSIRDATIEAFNNQLATLRANRKTVKTKVNFVTFSTTVDEPIFWGIGTKKAKRLTREDYVPSGWTALNDAIGFTVEELKNYPESHKYDDTYLVFILTDGEENRSKEYSDRDIKKMIKELEATGKWTFTYTGANVDLRKVRRTYGMSVANTRSFKATNRGVAGQSASWNAIIPGVYTSIANNTYNNKEFFNNGTNDTVDVSTGVEIDPEQD